MLGSRLRPTVFLFASSMARSSSPSSPTAPAVSNTPSSPSSSSTLRPGANADERQILIVPSSLPHVTIPRLPSRASEVQHNPPTMPLCASILSSDRRCESECTITSPSPPPAATTVARRGSLPRQ